MRFSEKALLLLGGAALAAAAFREKLVLKTYPIRSPKISAPVKLLQISDLHSSLYGEKQSELISLTDKLAPDAILLTGDILDNRVPNVNALTYLKYVGKRYSCFYVSGNHEIYTGFLSEIKQLLCSFGITVLEGESKSVILNGQSITLSGIDDPYICIDKKGRLWEDQLEECANSLNENEFSVLLSHRPEPVSSYTETDFDLILSGHAHGGQVIIPGMINGLYAPHQGMLPKYAGGKYVLDNGSVMIVSRGLSKYVRPRVFNRPEAVLITLLPE